jgi:hypothetical protein
MMFSYPGLLVSPDKCEDGSLMHFMQQILLRNSSYTFQHLCTLINLVQICSYVT